MGLQGVLGLRAPVVTSKVHCEAPHLHVPTRTGWQPADRAAFSSSWTRLGKTLEIYLVESAAESSDCQQELDTLLVDHEDWPVSPDGTKQHWVRFLEIIGVDDGLRPTAADMQRKGSPRYYWNDLLRHGDPVKGF